MTPVGEFHLEELDLRTYNVVQIDVMQKLAEHFDISFEECAPRFADAYREHVRGNPEIARALKENRDEAIVAIAQHILVTEEEKRHAA